MSWIIVAICCTFNVLVAVYTVHTIRSNRK